MISFEVQYLYLNILISCYFMFYPLHFRGDVFFSLHDIFFRNCDILLLYMFKFYTQNT